MFYEPKKNDHGLSKNPFKSCTVPRVIGWISTKNEDGSDNLAPYSQFTNLTFDPPMVIFAANQNVFGDRKNTVKNIERTGEFVYNMVSYDLKDAMNASSIAKLPEGYADKFEYSGVTKAPSQLIDVARVAESPIQYECHHLPPARQWRHLHHRLHRGRGHRHPHQGRGLHPRRKGGHLQDPPRGPPGLFRLYRGGEIL